MTQLWPLTCLILPAHLGTDLLDIRIAFSMPNDGVVLCAGRGRPCAHWQWQDRGVPAADFPQAPAEPCAGSRRFPSRADPGPHQGAVRTGAIQSPLYVAESTCVQLRLLQVTPLLHLPSCPSPPQPP
jgi:hypothetical protein